MERMLIDGIRVHHVIHKGVQVMVAAINGIVTSHCAPMGPAATNEKLLDFMDQSTHQLCGYTQTDKLLMSPVTALHNIISANISVQERY